MTVKVLPSTTPTQDLWGCFQNTFDYLNDVLFEGKLPQCILNFASHRGSKAYFTSRRWVATQPIDVPEISHEISLNPLLLDEPKEEAFAWLVRQMVHLWQEEFGIPNCRKQRYFNREFSDEMEALGLPCSENGTPEGKKTGFRMQHWIEPDGLFAKAVQDMPDDIFPWKGNVKPKPPKRLSYKYSCEICDASITAPREVHLTCNTMACNQIMTLVN